MIGICCSFYWRVDDVVSTRTGTGTKFNETQWYKVQSTGSLLALPIHKLAGDATGDR
jgi:hypothetical protein